VCRRVDLVRTDVSEEHFDFIISVEIISEAGTTLAVTSNYILEDGILQGNALYI
jgi:hypothetical protein